MHVFLSEAHIQMLQTALYHAKDSHGNYVMVGERHPIAMEIAKEIYGENILPPFGIKLGETVFWVDDERTRKALENAPPARGRIGTAVVFPDYKVGKE